MSKYKGPMTAEEFMKQLSTDTEYLRLRAEKDEKSRIRTERLNGVSKPILMRLADVGFPADSFQSLVKQYAPLPEQVVLILLDSLTKCDEERIMESLVRAMGASESPFDGRPLINCFDSTTNEGLRFAILNTIALAKPHSIDKWLEKARQSESLRQKLSDLGYDWPQP